ncbi:Chaperone protein TorD [Shimia sp. SK013]|uniref:molecular chaperone TorD family protein n=1 Tax=Shimia sp. SK013 TaxID=1389006 RepID=UPI0006B644FC|nr:molecular chaperone TorD family protein [Shimia sp. SK013]KPA23362.1 Chaperone protein TorD [Shimia sp. SK013]
MKSTAQEAISLSHADVCRWLAQVFMTEVTNEQLTAYYGGAAGAFFVVMSEVCDVSAQRADFEAALVELPVLDTSQRSLAADYAAMFLLGERTNAQPYAGLFSEGTGKVFGATHDSMVARFAARGLSQSVPTNEPADHISFLLEYTSVLLAAPDDGAETAQDFLRNEILPWFDRWAEAACRVQVLSRFYPAVVKIAQTYLAGLAKA